MARRANSSRRGVVLAALLIVPLAACDGRRDALVVLAAASLGAALPDVARAYEARDAARRVRFSFAGSQTLAAQLRAGAPCDLIATANTALIRDLEREGRVLDVREFASNRLVWVFRRELAPAGPDALVDELPRSSWRLVIAAAEVPAGGYALEALRRLGLEAAVAERVVSHELDVRGVLSKLRLGGADAGLVYATDLAGLDESLVSIELPERAQARARYAAAAVAGGNERDARIFLDFLTSAAGQQQLMAHGFGAAP